MAITCEGCGRPFSEHVMGKWCRSGYDDLERLDSRNSPPPPQRQLPANKKKEAPVPKKYKPDHTSWLKSATDALGGSQRACPHCDGSGQVDKVLTVPEAGLALVGVKTGSAQALATRLERLAWDDLTAMHEAISEANPEETWTVTRVVSWARELAAEIRRTIDQ